MVRLWRFSLRQSAGLTGIGGGGLCLLWLAYALTLERAPGIRVRWRDDVTVAQQAERERMYLLANGRATMPEAPRSIAYDLLDTSSRNIAAIVTDTRVADTNDIDRDNFKIGRNASPGELRMWLADRIPGLRYRTVRVILIAGLAIMALVGLEGLLTAIGL